MRRKTHLLTDKVRRWYAKHCCPLKLERTDETLTAHGGLPCWPSSMKLPAQPTPPK